MDYSPLWISIQTALAATCLTAITGVLAAWRLMRVREPAKGVLDALLTLPMVLPPTVAGFILLLVLGRNGPIGSLLNHLNMPIIFTWPATVIAAFAVSFPIMYKTCRGAFDQIDACVLNAARTLGATERRIFWKVAVPLAWPGILAGSALSFTRAIGEFGATLMVAGNIPGKTQTIPMAIFFYTEAGQSEKALLWVLLILGLSSAVLMAMNYWNGYQKKLSSPERRRSHVAFSGYKKEAERVLPEYRL